MANLAWNGERLDTYSSCHLAFDLTEMNDDTFDSILHS